MLIREHMTDQVVTIPPDMPIQDCLELMRRKAIRRVPIVNKKGKLVGIVSEEDLLNASPSSATSLSQWELNYLISKITVKQVMTKDVITIHPDTALEDAARVMADNEIGGMPVVEDGKIVGIITETDLFRTFLEMLGARDKGVRMVVLAKDVPGKLAELASKIGAEKGNIIALSTYPGDEDDVRKVTVIVDGISQVRLEEIMAPVVEEILDVRVK